MTVTEHVNGYMGIFIEKIDGRGCNVNTEKICIIHVRNIENDEWGYLNNLIDLMGYELLNFTALPEFRAYKDDVVMNKRAAPHFLITDISATTKRSVEIHDFQKKGTNILLIQEDMDTSGTEGMKVFASLEQILYFLEGQTPEADGQADDMDLYISDGMEEDESSDLVEASHYISSGSVEEPEEELPLPMNETNTAGNGNASAREDHEYIRMKTDDEEEVYAAIRNITEFQSAQATVKEISTGTEGEQLEQKEEVSYQENPFYIRSRNLQKQLFARQKWENHRMVGVWSPLHRMGVTSLVINFSFFLAQNRVYTAVLEGLTSQHAMKDWLKRYTSVPPNWISYASTIQDNVKTPMDAGWLYNNVTFLPLDQKDIQYEWHTLSLETYMTTTKIIDVTLVDLPTGEMENYTRDSIHYLDELWIVVDDAIQETLAWKGYIENIKQETGIPVKLIFNKHYPFSQCKRIVKEMDLPLITTIPSLHEETMQNYYETVPLYFKENVKPILEEPFVEMASQLFNGDFKILDTADVNKEISFGEKFIRPFKSIFRPLKN